MNARYCHICGAPLSPVRYMEPDEGDEIRCSEDPDHESLEDAAMELMPDLDQRLKELTLDPRMSVDTVLLANQLRESIREDELTYENEETYVECPHCGRSTLEMIGRGHQTGCPNA